MISSSLPGVDPMFRIFTLTLILFSSPLLFAQTDTIDNRAVIEMSRSGLSVEIILKKIGLTRTAKFDVSAASLIELKSAGVDDAVIAAMMDRSEASLPPEPGKPWVGATFSESGPAPPLTRQDAIASAKTIAFGKSSLQPSRQALEKELLKRKDFQQLNLTILRYKEIAHLFVDIGFVVGAS